MKTGTKIAIGIGGLVLVGGLIFLMTRKKDDEITAVEEEQPDENGSPESEYGGNTIFDSGSDKAEEYGGNTIFDSGSQKDVADTPPPARTDWTQDPYYYYF